MRNFSPSAFIAMSLLIAGLTLTVQAADGNASAPKTSTNAETTNVPAQQGTVNSSKHVSGQKGAEAPSALTAEAAKPAPQVTASATAGTGAAPQSIPKATKEDKPTKQEPMPVAVKLDPFTGKISKNKVRVRVQPTFDAAVFRELNHDDLVVVVGESDEFYAVQPPADAKAYVYRTFVLDNVIEGSHVNARLKPDLEAPVVAQLNSGDRVEGTIYSGNNKWMEIKLPAATRFYVAKEYIAKAGDAGLKARLENKQEGATELLNKTEGLAKTEMQKPFDQINIEGLRSTYQHLMKDYPEFPQIAAKAKEAWITIQEAYTAKKVAFLETQTRTGSLAVETNKKLEAELQAQRSKVNQLEQQIEKNRQIAATLQPQLSKPTQLPVNMTYWIPAEESLLDSWTQKSGSHSAKDFYEEQKKQAFILKGIIDPYNRAVKNIPGDYMLLNAASKLPVAFLYSTLVNLQDYVGHEVSILVVPRTNNNFAFPAYFVLHLE